MTKVLNERAYRKNLVLTVNKSRGGLYQVIYGLKLLAENDWLNAYPDLKNDAKAMLEKAWSIEPTIGSPKMEVEKKYFRKVLRNAAGTMSTDTACTIADEKKTQMSALFADLNTLVNKLYIEMRVKNIKGLQKNIPGLDEATIRLEAQEEVDDAVAPWRGGEYRNVLAYKKANKIGLYAEEDSEDAKFLGSFFRAKKRNDKAGIPYPLEDLQRTAAETSNPPLFRALYAAKFADIAAEVLERDLKQLESAKTAPYKKDTPERDR